MIMTNKCNVTYNMDNINQDFDVFLISKPKDLYTTNILDTATDSFHARAVQYSFGGTTLVLFDKNATTEQQFKSSVLAEYPDVKIQKLDLMNEEICKKHFYYKYRLLLQLLVNTLRIPRIDGFAYNNLTGKLLYRHQSWERIDKETKQPYSLCFLEISFDPGMYLNLKVKTFRNKQKSRDGRYYVFDSKTGNFRRKLRTDKVSPSKIFVEEGFKGSKNTIKYLDFSSFEGFRKSKLGVMEQFLRDVKKHLSRYISLSVGVREAEKYYSESKKEKETLSLKDFAQILKKRGVNIEDVCESEESSIMTQRLTAELQLFYGITPQTGYIKRHMYNIRIIHDADYYVENNLPDPHEDCVPGYILQHLTLENNSSLLEAVGEKQSVIVHKIITELILKDDVYCNQIKIYNWAKLNSNKEWTFVIRSKIKEPNNESHEAFENLAGRKTWNHYLYNCVQIDRSGRMQFFSFDDFILPRDSFEKKIRLAFDTYEVEQRHGQKKVEGLVFSDIDNIHAIIRTLERVLPNTQAISNALLETSGKELLIKNDILEASRAFNDLYPDCSDYGQMIIDELLASKSATILKKDLKKTMNLRKYKNAGVKYNRFLHTNYGIWISPEIKNSSFDDTYMLSNLTEIQYFLDDNTDGKGILSFNYYVGPPNKNLKLGITTSCAIRQVQAQNNIEFEELLPLMSVEYVRAGQYTVLPFPFKYLREYQKKVNIQNEIAEEVDQDI